MRLGSEDPIKRPQTKSQLPKKLMSNNVKIPILIFDIQYDICKINWIKVASLRYQSYLLFPESFSQDRDQHKEPGPQEHKTKVIYLR